MGEQIVYGLGFESLGVWELRVLGFGGFGSTGLRG